MSDTNNDELSPLVKKTISKVRAKQIMDNIRKIYMDDPTHFESEILGNLREPGRIESFLLNFLNDPDK